MATLIADNAYGTLASGLAAGDTTLNFTSGHGARFPVVAAPDVMYACILNTANVLEEVKITAHTANADSCTIVRAQGGTTAKVWAAGDRIEARISQQVLGDLITQGTSALAVNVQGGGAGQVVYQVGTSSSGFVLGTASDIMVSNGTGSPSFVPRDTMNVGAASTATLAIVAQSATSATQATHLINGRLAPHVQWTITDGYSITTSDCTVEIGTPAARTVYLPAVPENGRMIVLINHGTVLLGNAAKILTPTLTGFTTATSLIAPGVVRLVYISTNNGWVQI